VDDEIDRQRLSYLAGIAFQGLGAVDVPEKIWVDSYDDTLFVRAAWADGITPRRIDRLEDLKLLLADEYEVEVVAVAYMADMPWPDIEARSVALKAVR